MGMARVGGELEMGMGWYINKIIINMYYNNMH